MENWTTNFKRVYPAANKHENLFNTISLQKNAKYTHEIKLHAFHCGPN